MSYGTDRQADPVGEASDRWLLGCALLMLVLAMTACTGASKNTPARRSGAITVGSFDFPESVVLADLYAEALAAHGYRVRVLPNIGPREVVDPALARGLLDLVPEYGGSAFTFFDQQARSAPHDSASTHAALARAVVPRGLVALSAASAQDANAIVVTQETARRYHLRTISDLAPIAHQLILGGPPECPQRPLCLRGLRSLYGLSFRSFVGLDVDGPLTLQALINGDIGAAVLYTTLPAKPDHLVILRDDRGLQPAESITPVVRREVLNRYGSAFADVVNAVSDKLTTPDLTALDAALLRNPASAPAVARRWLTEHALL